VTSGWYVYRFPTSSFPDYPKFSVWSDGYYITANKDQGSAGTSQVVFALERDKMIAGNTSAQMIGFPLTGIITSGFYSPLGFNANGPTPPPAGNAPIVYMQDDSWSGVSTDHLKIWSINVNWTTPASSTISSPQIINTTPFDGLFDGGSFSNLPQPSGSDIDALQATIMYMAQYRRFPTYNTVVFNFVVDLDGNDNKSGIRWYELRQTAHGQPWTIYQEGTYAQPNGHSAFCGNMCMDINGNIGMGYTIVSTTINPALRFTGRYASDPSGTMTLTEEVIITGTSVDPSSRYGDYAQMTVDPVDGTTFWTISEYFSSGRKNRCATFQIAPPALTAMFSGTPTTICTGGSVTFTDASLASPTSWNWSFQGGTPSSYVGQTPPPIVYSTAGTYDVSLTVSDGTDTDTDTKTGYITVNNVIANFTGAPTTVVVGNSVTFTDNSSCSPATWEWSFPGGNPSSYSGQAPPAITYNTVGTYDVTLTVTKPGASDAKTRTGYITVTPPIFNMTNGTVTTCTGDFYDSGGSSGVYQDNETYVMTFYPSTAGDMIRFTFTSFTTESGYDTLTIYNGANSSGTLIGKYHGSTSPGTVTATNASGALTFRFHSDGSVTYAGWAATISCYNTATPPVANFSATPLNAQVGQTVTFTDLTTNGPTSWAWSFNPGTVTYVDATSATSQNPHVQFLALGQYSVTLTATNAYGSNAATKTNYINVTNCTVAAYPWTEGFENGGVIPNCWTQEQVNSSGVNWVFITGNGTGYPASAHGGTYDACLKDGNSADNKTRLITPALDLTNLPSPQLTFWHTQTFWSPDQDILTVYYRTSPAASWTQLATYTNDITTWTQETLSLPSASATCQINFEGNAKWGRGVCIDDVTVSSACPTIYQVGVSVAASANPVDEGTEVTFTATPSHGGTTPSYQWKVNGNNAGTNSSTYAYIPADGDAVTCILTSGETCVTGNPATSNTITMAVNSVPANLSVTDVTVTGSQCFDATDSITVAGGGTTFTVNYGGIARMYAGESIIYYPGTDVNEGGYLLGKIVPGGPYCPPDTKQPAGIAGPGVTDQAQNDFFRIYPNPTTGAFTLAIDKHAAQGKINVVIFDMQGATIETSDLFNEIKHDFSLTGAPAGLYLVRVSTGQQTGSARIIKTD
jgi:PKD repeat protein